MTSVTVGVLTSDEDDLWGEREQAFAALRSARRRNRVAQLDWFDAFYKAYVTAIFSAIAVYAGAGAFGDVRLTGTQLIDVRSHGPAWVGLLAAFVVAIGLRSGGRGGPLALERADVRHVLLSPVPRELSVRKPALRQLRHGAFLGAAVGLAGGLIAVRRLPHNPTEWVLCAGLFGAAVAIASYGAAMVMGGLRVSRSITDSLSLVVLLWSGADIYFEVTTSPLTCLGKIVTWPLHFDPLALIGLAVALALAGLGAWTIAGWSVEAAERRSRLVGQLRFAATLQDVRTVMVLQRQLAQEHLRVKPWFRLPKARKSFKSNGEPRNSVFIRRSLNGLARWPLFRIVRLVVLAFIAGFAVCGAWAGTTPLLVVTGVATWLMALDLLEPLAQETDRPDRYRSIGKAPGPMLVRHLVVPFFVLVILVAIGSIPAVILGPNDAVQSLLAPIVLSSAFLALGGAALAVTKPPSMPNGSMQTPEIAGLLTLWRVAVPPALAVAGVAPLFFARKSWNMHHDVTKVLTSMNNFWFGALACGTWAVAWIRYGDDLRNAMEGAGRNAFQDKPAAKPSGKITAAAKQSSSKSADKGQSGAKKSTPAKNSNTSKANNSKAKKPGAKKK